MNLFNAFLSRRSARLRALEKLRKQLVACSDQLTTLENLYWDDKNHHAALYPLSLNLSNAHQCLTVMIDEEIGE